MMWSLVQFRVVKFGISFCFLNRDGGGKNLLV
jgi:hypothetical protein